jgi:hypothetical protein
MRMQNQGRWDPCVVTEHLNSARSHRVETEHGNKYRRNRGHLLQTLEESEPED